MIIGSSFRSGCGHEGARAHPCEDDNKVEIVQGSYAAIECSPTRTTRIRHFIVHPQAPRSPKKASE
jgi:hypothetical protein